MDLDCVTHSEVSQKEKKTNILLTHACGIYKNDRDDFICKEGIETIYMDTKGKRDGVGGIERLDLAHIHHDTLYKIGNY